jgi:hypothetical protein
VDDTTLARLAHQSMIDAWIAVGGQVAGAHVERAGGVAVICTGLPLRLFNQVLVADPMATDDAVIAAVAAARKRTDRFFVNLRVGTDDRFVPLMDRLGLEADQDELSTPGMVMHPLSATVSAKTPSAIDLRRITSEAGIPDHVTVAASSFGIPEEWLAALVTEGLLRQPGVTLLVGYRDSAPVTTGLGIRTGRSISIYNIATLESARGHGFGAATTMRLVADGFADGCDVAVLQSSPLARPLYERLGFRRLIQYLGFAPPDRTATTRV